MDRDLHNRLQWLEDELFEEENPTPDAQDFDLDDILNEFLTEEELPQQMPSRNRAVDFDRMAFGDEDFDDSTAVLVSRKKTKEKPAPKQAKAKEKKKSNKGLVIVAILEVIAILAVLLRWALWFL